MTSYNVDEGSITNLDLCANDSDIDDGLDLTSIAITSGPANGSIIVNADGTVDYTHDGSETVADSFSYTIKDNLGNVSNIATVTINVNPVNDAPTTTGIADVTVNEDTLVTFINLQTSFADAEDPDTALVYTITNNTDPGLFSSITIGGAGGLNMNYAANQNGTADITVRATDTGGKFVETTFTVTVNAVNDAPVVNATASDTGTEDTDVVYTHAQLLTLIGATDVDDANANLSIAITNVTNGTLVMSGGTGGAGTTYTFTPTADFAGNLTFDYQVSDDESPTPATSGPVGTATVAIAAVNDAPVVNATASDTGTEDTDVVYTHAQLLTLIGATDVDDANANLSISITNVNNGTLVMSGGSGGAGTTFTFTPTADFVGNLTFDYQVSDDEAPTPATSTVGTATVAIAAVNDVPVASASTVSTSEDNAYSFGVGDFTYSDVEGDSLVSVTITNLNLAGGTLEHSGGTTVINGMTITAAQIASLVYTPAANVSGAPLATFDFSVNDADAGVTTAQMDIDVTPVNDTPVANSDIILAGEDTGQTAGAPGIMANDSDAEGTAGLYVYAVNGIQANVGSTITLASGARLTVNADGSTSYDTNGAFEYLGAGDSANDSFTYTISDAGGLTATRHCDRMDNRCQRCAGHRQCQRNRQRGHCLDCHHPERQRHRRLSR